jgi:acetylglutamate kinase
VTAEALTIKLGGVAGQTAAAIRRIADAAPDDTVVVHGGGHEIGDWSKRVGLEARMLDGLRVTDPDTLDVAIAVLAGLVNTRLVVALEMAGRCAVGLSGADAGLLRLRRRDPALGEVGEVVGVDARILHALIEAGMMPVVAPIGRNETGAILNVNADEAAGAIAGERGGRLLLCTDVAGVELRGSLLDRLDAELAERMLLDGSAGAGMRPKLRAALSAARAGCLVRIVDGRSEDALARAIAGGSEGTLVTAA